jgi:peptidyl-prolyl cis-trans isomerase SurA
MKPQIFLAALLGVSAVHAEPGKAPAKPARSGPIEVNAIAAKVNGRVVTKNQISFMLAPIYAQLAAQFPRRGAEFEKRLKEARDKILAELIDREIILSEFKMMGAHLKGPIVEEEIDRQIREIYNGDEAKFREELKKSRLTMDGYREMTRDKLVVQAMRAQHFSDAPPPLPNEIEKEYAEIKTQIRDMSKDQISFQKIFIAAMDPQNPAATPEIQLAKIEDVAKQLEAGKDFTELAKANSMDAFAAQGGVQENVPRTDLSPEFAAILFEAEEGKIVGPLQDPSGFTLVKVNKKHLGPPPPLSKVRDQLEERVRRKKTSTEYERWIATKRKHAIIEKKI